MNSGCKCLKVSAEQVFAKFNRSNIDKKELEKIISDAVADECNGEKIDSFVYGDRGVVVYLDSGEEIFIDIDWDEINIPK